MDLFSNAEARKHPIQHRFGELFSGDLPQRADRLPQVDRPEVPRELLGRHLLAAFEGLGGSGGQIALALVQRHQHAVSACSAGVVVLEASGIQPEQLQAFAATGIDLISTSAPVTRSRWLDLSMRFT